MILGQIDYGGPLIWGLLIGWIFSVTLHELAHGVVAYLGGDYTIRERGGLTLNPFHYAHPINSLVMPVIFLLIGGIPLPGAATYVRRDLLRGRGWDSAVSAAGPAMNILLFVILGLICHPRFGWIDRYAPASEWSTAQAFVAALAFLQLFAAILNLLPIPSFDGFGIIFPYLSPEMQQKAGDPQVGNFCMIGFFILMMSTKLSLYLHMAVYYVGDALGMDMQVILRGWARLFGG
jgi:Zn-dependent protease